MSHLNAAFQTWRAPGRFNRWHSVMIGVVMVILPFALAFGMRNHLDVARLEQWGLLGVFLINAIASASLFVVTPGIATVAAAGLLWHPVWVGLASGLGSATGELTAYLAGRGGSQVASFENNPRYRQLQAWLSRHGFWPIMVLAAAPLPFFDLAGIIAGSTGYPMARFWLACAIGKSIRNSVIAAIGFHLITWFR